MWKWIQIRQFFLKLYFLLMIFSIEKPGEWEREKTYLSVIKYRMNTMYKYGKMMITMIHHPIYGVNEKSLFLSLTWCVWLWLIWFEGGLHFRRKKMFIFIFIDRLQQPTKNEIQIYPRFGSHSLLQMSFKKNIDQWKIDHLNLIMMIIIARTEKKITNLIDWLISGLIFFSIQSNQTQIKKKNKAK